MTDTTIGMTPSGLSSGRKCGACSVCCTALGIEELKKHAQTPCKHLTTKNGAARQCSIYARRPDACARYKCGWIDGLLDDATGRPDRSGLLIHAMPDEKTGYCIYIQIVDERRCGTVTEGKLAAAIKQLCELGAPHIVIWNPKTKGVIQLRPDGKIYSGNTLEPKGIEDLDFVTFDPPVGEWKLVERAIQ